MCDHAHPVATNAVRENSSLAEGGTELRRRSLQISDIEDDDVGSHGRGIDADSWYCREGHRQVAGVIMIGCQLCRRLFQRDESRGGKDSDLPHAAA